MYYTINYIKAQDVSLDLITHLQLLYPSIGMTFFHMYLYLCYCYIFDIMTASTHGNLFLHNGMT